MTQTSSNTNNLIKTVNLIFNVNEKEFANKVIEASNDKIILADFWAPWCNPCKQLSPLLEEVVKEAGGIVSLAKINIDDNKQLAGQLRIQSIPTVIAFNKKQIANGFQGVIPKQKIIEFIEKIHGSPIQKNNSEFYDTINNLIADNQLDQANNSLENYLSENSNDTKAIALYIKCLSEQNKFDDLKKFIKSLSDKMLSDTTIDRAIKNYKMSKAISQEPPVDVLLSNYNKDPTKIENMVKLSDKYFFEKKTKEAFDLLISSFSKCKDKDKEQIKKTLLKYFDALGNNHEQTKIYRRKLSGLLFS